MAARQRPDTRPAPAAAPLIEFHVEDKPLPSQPDNTSDIQAALYEARDEVGRLRQHGASDLEIARAAIADFLRHLPSHVFEEPNHHTGEPLNHALAHAVEAVALDDDQGVVG